MKLEFNLRQWLRGIAEVILRFITEHLFSTDFSFTHSRHLCTCFSKEIISLSRYFFNLKFRSKTLLKLKCNLLVRLHRCSVVTLLFFNQLQYKDQFIMPCSLVTELEHVRKPFEAWVISCVLNETKQDPLPENNQFVLLDRNSILLL